MKYWEHYLWTTLRVQFVAIVCWQLSLNATLIVNKRVQSKPYLSIQWSASGQMCWYRERRAQERPKYVILWDKRCPTGSTSMSRTSVEPMTASNRTTKSSTQMSSTKTWWPTNCGQSLLEAVISLTITRPTSSLKTLLMVSWTTCFRLKQKKFDINYINIHATYLFEINLSWLFFISGVRHSVQ